jgi:hypothetical protein
LKENRFTAGFIQAAAAAYNRPQFRHYRALGYSAQVWVQA